MSTETFDIYTAWQFHCRWHYTHAQNENALQNKKLKILLSWSAHETVQDSDKVMTFYFHHRGNIPIPLSNKQ